MKLAPSPLHSYDESKLGGDCHDLLTLVEGEPTISTSETTFLISVEGFGYQARSSSASSSSASSLPSSSVLAEDKDDKYNKEDVEMDAADSGDMPSSSVTPSKPTKASNNKKKSKNTQGPQVSKSVVLSNAMSDVENEKKPKLRTSEDVYKRIKHDDNLHSEDYSIVYEDHKFGDQEVAFDEFDKETIPFHRIWLYKRGGEIIWDRKNRVDLLFGSGDTPKN